jgi:hypothetical protein
MKLVLFQHNAYLVLLPLGHSYFNIVRCKASIHIDFRFLINVSLNHSITHSSRQHRNERMSFSRIVEPRLKLEETSKLTVSLIYGFIKLILSFLFLALHVYIYNWLLSSVSGVS